MKRQEKDKLKQMTASELESKLGQLKTELLLATQQNKLGKLENKKTTKNLRYQIALIKTYQKQLETNKGTK